LRIEKPFVYFVVGARMLDRPVTGHPSPVWMGKNYRLTAGILV
jgi:hypothetical protein